MLCTWSKLYKAFARCSALVVTAEENICCEELCVKMSLALDKMDLQVRGGNDACRQQRPGVRSGVATASTLHRQ